MALHDILNSISDITDTDETVVLMNHLNTLIPDEGDISPKLLTLLMSTMLFDDELLQRLMRNLLKSRLNKNKLYNEELKQLSSSLWPMKDFCLGEITELTTRCELGFLITELSKTGNARIADDLFAIALSISDKMYDLVTSSVH